MIDTLLLHLPPIDVAMKTYGKKTYLNRRILDTTQPKDSSCADAKWSAVLNDAQPERPSEDIGKENTEQSVLEMVNAIRHLDIQEVPADQQVGRNDVLDKGVSKLLLLIDQKEIMSFDDILKQW